MSSAFLAMRRRILGSVAASMALSGCAAYKVEPVSAQARSSMPHSAKAGEAKSLRVVPDQASNIEGRGFQCYEPLLYALSLGLIPAVCVRGYELRSDNEVLGRYEVSMMMGWAAMFAAMSPAWSLGSGDERAEAQIRRQSQRNSVTVD